MDTDNGSTFHLCYRAHAPRNPNPRDHFIKDGEPLCYHDVSVPEEDLLKPIEEISHVEWAVLLRGGSNLCTECADRIESHGKVPDDLSDEPPVFNCPICDEPPEDISFVYNTVNFSHFDKSIWPPKAVEHKFPREWYDSWRQNPDEPFSYPNLKEYIDENLRLFR